MPDTVEHKPAAECPMTAPHDPALCGLVQARRRRSEQMNAAIERQRAEERERATGRRAG